MMRGIYLALIVAVLGGGWLFANRPATIQTFVPAATTSAETSISATTDPLKGIISEVAKAAVAVLKTATSSPAAHSADASTESNSGSIALASGQALLSPTDLFKLADDTYADGSLPLGDYKYVTAAPKKGYIYLCNVHKDNPGSMVNGPWMHGESWNYLQKVSVSGAVSWPNATFSNTISGSLRSLQGNGLPVGHTTGVFPVQSGTAAAQYDPNPNTISVQSLKQQLPADPVYSATPYCMGGEVGIMTDGVPLFNGFDAGLRDAAAHELQDACDGHPQGSGEYHYHSLSACFKDMQVTTVLGYAFDGFPITGPEVATGKYLTTADLDECHGITSEILVDGKKKMTYHYVMTRDFPYSASCFRGKPSTMMAISGQAQQSQSQSQSQNTSGPQQSGPPQEALNACSGKASGASCSFTDSHGTISGTCGAPPNMALACHP